jgi:DNA polymerase-3 subunit delta
MAGEPLDPVYLIVGGDTPKIAHALRRLRARFDAASVDQLVAGSAPGETSGADAVAATNALGLFGGGERLVVVDAVERWKKADVEAIDEYLASPTPGAVLALRGDSAKLPSGLEPACARTGRVLRYDLPAKQRGKGADYVAWVRRQLEQAGVRARADVAPRLVELAGEDAFALQGEVEKLAAWAGDDEVEPADLDRLIAPAEDTPAWALGDGLGSRDVSATLAVVESMLEQDEPFRVASRLADHATKIRAAHALLDDDLGAAEIATRLGLKPFPARKLVDQARNFGAGEAGRAVVRLAALDYAIKGGSRLDPHLEIERAVVEVTCARDPHG